MIRRSLAGADWTVRAVPAAELGAVAGAGNGAGGGAALSTAHDAGCRAMPEAVRSRVFPATVPGCVHADLQRAGVLADVDIGQGELSQEWVGWTDWQWECAFDAPASLLAHARCELVLDGLDTVAIVHVNGVLVGTASNQFHPHRMDVRRALREGSNELRVMIRAPVAWVLEQQRVLGARPVNGDWTPYPFVRKSACSFGWDWGPRAPSSGIGGAWLEAWSDARMVEARPLVTSANAASATVEVHVRIERAMGDSCVHAELAEGRASGMDGPKGAPAERAPLEVAVELEGPDGRVVRGRAAVDGSACMARLTVDRPALWWPRGSGAQPLYDLRVQLVPSHGASAPLASERRRIGLRTVELDTSPDEHGTRFALKVNGTPVYCVGANWIPASLHPVTAPRERTASLLELACEANINMLRVWGGGIYEPEHFYELCDALGIMVWQDFMFACATYPEDPPYPEQVEAEARYQIARLSSHPSVVLWCGGNENVVAWQAWGFRERLAPGQSWGRGFWLELLPALCAKLDPTRPYWPDSPWSGSLELPANDPDRGDRHTWDLKVEEYRTQVPRFASEFGHQSPPNLCTLREAIGGDGLRVHGAELARRQRAGGGDGAQYDAPLSANFAPAADFSEWLYHAHLLHARAMACAITWLRANRPRNMGCLFWQWNDVWSGPSWAVVDVGLRPKPAWHAVRRAAQPRLVGIEPLGAGLAPLRVALVNDTNDAWHPWVMMHRLSLDGTVLAHARERAAVPPRSVDAGIIVAGAVGAPVDEAGECIMVEADGLRAWWHFRRDREQRRFPARVRVKVQGAGRRWVATVTALTMVRDLWVEPLDAWVQCTPNLLTLLPSESAEIDMELAAPHGADAAASARGSSGPRLRMHAAGGVQEVPSP